MQKRSYSVMEASQHVLHMHADTSACINKPLVRAGVAYLRDQILRCDPLSPRGRIKLQKTPEGHQSIFFLKSMLIAFVGYCQSKNYSRGTRS